jgi:hypothetical protein
MLSMQEPNALATKSVGLKRSPLPWLSFGASVSTMLPLCKWVISVRKSPLYTIWAVIFLFLVNLN